MQIKLWEADPFAELLGNLPVGERIALTAFFNRLYVLKPAGHQQVDAIPFRLARLGFLDCHKTL